MVQEKLAADQPALLLVSCCLVVSRNFVNMLDLFQFLIRALTLYENLTSLKFPPALFVIVKTPTARLTLPILIHLLRFISIIISEKSLI